MDNELIDLCNEIFKNLISQITMHLRFMDIALAKYIFVPNSLSIECDGIYLYYDPIYLIKTFKNNPNSLTRGYLHIVLHSIFRHQYLTFNCNRQLWNLACDIAVENMIMELNLDCMEIANSEEMNKEIDKLKSKINLLTAQKVYHYLQDELNSDQIKWLSDLFYFDDHSRWYSIRDVTNSSTNLYGEESKDDPTKSGRNRFDNASHESDEPDDESKLDREESDDQNKENDELSDQEIIKIKDSMKEWKEISEKIETDLETFSKEYGEQASSMVQSLARLNREKYNYTTFLRKFMTTGEKQMINDEEFDYVFYTYGLQLYKNMPLIESLEYKETKSIRDFVIAIDTSGSVSGDIVQSFLQKTYNIFQQRENFFNKFNIHIIQCDAQIQHDEKITSLSEFDRYIKNIGIHGLGGTDFRPVFDYVDDLIMKKEFTNLEGLIYFTDGDGSYPKKQPDYLTAFVFLDKGNLVDAKVPSWAIKYILDEDEIINEQIVEEK